MTGRPEDFAAAMTRAVTALASACGPDDAAWAGRFEQAISAGESEAVQVAQLSKVLCSFTFEEGISVDLSEALTTTSNDSLDSGRQGALATETVRDGFFVPLGKHAATPEAVCWLSHAMRRITAGTDAGAARRSELFGTEAIRNGFFVPLVKHATSAEAVHSLSRAMWSITAGTDAGATRRSELFATEAIRDGFFVPLVKHAASAEAVYSLSRAMCSITAGTDAGGARRRDIFATEAVRDGFFVPLVKHAASAEACRWLSSAMSNTINGTDAAIDRRREIFATEAIRDGFLLPLVNHATSAEAVYVLSTAMCGITAGNDAGAARRNEIFATEAVRDGFFVPLVKHATSAEAVDWLSAAMCSITESTDARAARRNEIFATEAVRDGFFVPLVTHATSAEACQWLSGAMCNITAGADAGAARRKDVFATKAVRDGFFMPLVEYATSHDSVQWLSHACDSVSRCSATPFATAEMCDSFFLPLARGLGQGGVAAGDALLTAFSTVTRAVGVRLKKVVTASLATEFFRLLDSFQGLSATALSVRGLLAEGYPLVLHPLCPNAPVTTTVISKDTQLFWDLEEVLSASINGHNDDYVKSRIARRERPLMFTLVGATAVSNVVLEKRFEVMKTTMEKSGEYSANELRERRSFHGTHPRNIDAIITTSLLPFGHPLNSCQYQTDDGFFGVNTGGVYVGRYVDYVLKYSNREAPLEPRDEVDVIMFKTLPGKSKHIETASRGLQPTPDFDSHSSPDFLEWYLFESAQLCPTHVLRVRAVENKRTKADDGLPPP